ncbi:copper homeostasis protein CutC [Paenibacillus sp. BSR1-1]|uniref:copper homeostasis protein CutC n=1 Tax=Paenibacillus sp. BSR1-1 TaxID=3020845 RepID=UPI0025AFEBB3|nr:copper homeostasis protein CutC [Paenibacillus sp. BSR1-1]MDN3020021.1 copper homeostasis protein CutC [Paenibacillus sp. BSR1-1]
MIKEVCVENFTLVPEAIERGASRIELCDNLAVGGTTVSHGVAARTIKYCHSKNIKVMSIIRPRGGNFVYNKMEIDIMHEDIVHLKHLGTDGVVMGCLEESGWIDERNMHTLLQAASGLDITFHMAFDQIKPKYQLDAINWLAGHGVQRILTHGGPSDTAIENNLTRLKEYVNFAGGRIIILPGGGITDRNLEAIISKVNVREVHGTKIVGELGSK